MFLSIITINRNNAVGLKKTLESVASQTCRDFEHIIIDGASTDGSVDVINDYVASTAGKNVSYWISEPDSGVYNAMNKGIKKAIGDYCLFLNSGDWLFNSDTVKNEKETDHTEDIVFFDSINVKGNKNEKVEMPEKLDTLYFISGRTIYHQNELIKTYLLKENPYNEELKTFSDNEFNIKAIILQKHSYRHFHRTIVYYEALEGISSTQINLVQKEQNQVLTECFGDELVQNYKLLIDYELGYMGLLKKLRILLNYVRSIIIRTRKK